MAFRFAAHLRAQLKSSARLNGLRVAASGLLVLTPVAATQTFANPLGATVTTGSAAISDPSSQQMTIEQRSEDVVIDWQSFNIANGQTTQFVQPNAQAIAVNRIGGARASQIVGTLDANGRIVLINGNGILFARGSQVNVNSLVATYTDNTDSDVLAGSFSQAGNQNASIVNQGSIRASQGGLVALVAPNVTNAGTINARFGTVSLAAANKFTVDFAGDGLVSFAAEGDVIGHAEASNSGLLAGANVSLTAHAAEGLATGVVSMSGTVLAQTVRNQGGTIVLDAGDGALAVSGNVNAAGQTGGGDIETSGNQVAMSGDGSAATTIDSALDSGTSVTLKTTATGASGPGIQNPAGNGDIYVDSALSWNGAAALTLDAYHSIFIYAPITATRSGGLALLTNDGGTGGDLTFTGGNVTFDKLTSALTVNGETYALVDNIATLAADIAADPSGDYALAHSYNAHSDGIYSSSPIVTPFSGTFEGLGNTIANLTIDDASDTDVGLFASTASGAMVRDVVLSHAVVTGAATNASVGGLIGTMAAGSSVDDASVGGTIVSDAPFCRCDFLAGVGGLVGSSAGNIAASSSSANVWSEGQYDYTGGLIGTDTGTIANSYATGRVGGSDDPRVGGLVGVDDAITTDNSYATGAVSGSGTNVSIGGFAGQADGLIENSYATGKVSGSPTSEAGGLVGIEGGTVEYSYATGNVRGSQVGGLVGDEQGVGPVSNSYATGTVTAGYGAAAGGLVGVDFQSNITDSYATGAVSTGNAGISEGLFGTAGGLVGYFGPEIIAGSYALGPVTAGANFLAGGLVGENQGTIETSYASGAVTGGKSAVVGGLAGEGGEISNSYATGSATGGLDSVDGGLIGNEPGNVSYAYSSGAVSGRSGSTIGGLVGESSSDVVFDDDYWDMTTSGITNPSQGVGNILNQAHITGLTTAQFQSGLPTGFDPTVWAEDPSINDGLPYLLASPPS
jgi:filamentous hemagglutinin family protein